MSAETHDHARCIESALSKATRMCSEKGVQLTATRRRVLELVWSDHRAVKAYELLDRLGEGRRPAKPPTVYRALDFLMEQGLVHRVDSLNAFVGCAHPEHRHDGTLLICTACGGVTEIEADDIGAALERGAESAGFLINQRTVELHGTCAACRTS